MNSSKIKLSIVIPFYNREKFVYKLFSEIKSLNNSSTEFIFVNDGSTKAFNLKEGKNIKVLNLPKNLGVQAARNAGLSKAKGEKIIFFDSDDMLYYHKIKMLEDIQIESIGFCLPDICHFSGSNLKKRRPLRFKIIRSPTRSPTPTSFLIFNRHFLIRNHIFFDTDLLSSHDDDIYFNCLKYNSKPKKIAHWGGFMHHDGNRITTSNKYKQGRKQFLEKYKNTNIIPNFFLKMELFLIKFFLQNG